MRTEWVRSLVRAMLVAAATLCTVTSATAAPLTLALRDVARLCIPTMVLTGARTVRVMRRMADTLRGAMHARHREIADAGHILEAWQRVGTPPRRRTVPDSIIIQALGSRPHALALPRIHTFREKGEIQGLSRLQAAKSPKIRGGKKM